MLGAWLLENYFKKDHFSAKKFYPCSNFILQFQNVCRPSKRTRQSTIKKKNLKKSTY